MTDLVKVKGSIRMNGLGMAAIPILDSSGPKKEGGWGGGGIVSLPT